MQLRGSEANRYAESKLRRLASNSLTWESLYISPDLSDVWIMSYPESEYHGGGSPSLVKLEEGEVEAKIQENDFAVLENVNLYVEALIDYWCEKRSLEPLRHILAVWPHNGLTDGVSDLRKGLEGVRALGRGDLTEPEEVRVGQVLNLLDRILQNR